MANTQDSLLTRSRLLLIAVVTGGIIVPGLLRRFLGEAGYTDLGMLVFVLGYAGMVVVVWYGWLRPMDITGPEDQQF
ncbi:hypothetical protein ACFQJC_03065 [Haloferax namakaokahaiae]|uniref:Uncharacterized protein n=1 Tax=Haloferax namakaokahaiae TaxID=1748331 RepID=A0ABD5ZBQ6_9EURY